MNSKLLIFIVSCAAIVGLTLANDTQQQVTADDCGSILSGGGTYTLSEDLVCDVDTVLQFTNFVNGVSGQVITDPYIRAFFFLTEGTILDCQGHTFTLSGVPNELAHYAPNIHIFNGAVRNCDITSYSAAGGIHVDYFAPDVTRNVEITNVHITCHYGIEHSGIIGQPVDSFSITRSSVKNCGDGI